jgi:hypothetical protein
VNTSAKPTSLAKVMQLFVWVLGLLYAASRLIPCHPVSDYASQRPVDDAWAQVMHVGFAQHMQFGQDIVFTYGPWGFLARGYYPPTYLISVVAWVALASVFLCAGWRLARYFTDNQVIVWLWLMGFTALASLPAGDDIGNRLTAWGVLLLFLHFFVEERAFSPLQAALVFTLGWLGLVKFIGLMEGGFLVAVVAADNIVRHRRFPWIIPVWLAGIVFFWLLAGQHPDLLWPFLKNSWEVAKGYTDAMGTGVVFKLRPLIYVLLSAGFCIFGGMLIHPPRWRVAVFLIPGMAGIFFLSFKQGYVRADDAHEIPAIISLLLIGLACVAVAVTQKNRLLPGVVGLFCASISLSVHILHGGLKEGLLAQGIRTFSPYNLLSPIVSLTTHDLQDDYEKSLGQMREGIPLPPVRGGADWYSLYPNILFANGLEYRPRPVIQSYSAYTPTLARMNADWLRSDRAATNLFFVIQVLDSRFPPLDDGLSWPELLTRYDIKDISSEHLYLSRSSAPRKYELQLLQETNVALGTSFSLPVTNGPVWAEIEVSKTLPGDVFSLFYKPTTLMAKMKLADRSEHEYRLIPGMAKAGFLLSPNVINNKSFIALAQGNETALASKTVIAMTIFESDESVPAFCYQPQAKIRFYRLEFPAQDSKVRVP